MISFVANKANFHFNPSLCAKFVLFNVQVNSIQIREHDLPDWLKEKRVKTKRNVSSFNCLPRDEQKPNK